MEMCGLKEYPELRDFIKDKPTNLAWKIVWNLPLNSVICS